MATAVVRRTVRSRNRVPRHLHLTPADNGILLSPREFDAATGEDGWRYELINGVLIVSPAPSRAERHPNETLGYLLTGYQEHHPQGSALDLSLPEEEVQAGSNRRRVDRAIWAGLGRLPTADDIPSAIVEFVSAGRRNRDRDYEEKRDEFMALKVAEYWIIDRFQRTMTVFFHKDGVVHKRVLRENQVYRTPLLPGFELALAKLFAVADLWRKSKK